MSNKVKKREFEVIRTEDELGSTLGCVSVILLSYDINERNPKPGSTVKFTFKSGLKRYPRKVLNQILSDPIVKKLKEVVFVIENKVFTRTSRYSTSTITRRDLKRGLADANGYVVPLLSLGSFVPSIRRKDI